MRFDVLTLFPEMFAPFAENGINARARHKGIWDLHCWNPRDYTHDVHRTVDDRPYGGGPGMVMLAEPLEAALDEAQAARTALSSSKSSSTPVVLMSPTGAPFTQGLAQEWAQSDGAILVCGRYEGIDQRFIDAHITHEVSLGDFVLSGGEIAALAIIDSVVRLLPGVLNDQHSAVQDSFHEGLDGLLDSPHYTRPEVYKEQPIPAVLKSGNHKLIAQWRREQSLKMTAQRRPELIEQARAAGLLTKADEQFLQQLQA